MNIDKDELISEFAAQVGEDFQVNYFAQHDFPSVELVVMGCVICVMGWAHYVARAQLRMTAQ